MYLHIWNILCVMNCKNNKKIIIKIGFGIDNTMFYVINSK